MTINSQDLLRLMWLASPALPIGGFSYSEGLESAIDRAWIHDESSVQHWLGDQLLLAQARADMAVMAQMIMAWRTQDAARIQKLNQWVLQTRESAEFRLQTEQMGRSLLEWLKQLQFATEQQISFCQDPTYPLVMALALANTQANLIDCLHTYAFAWCENMVQAAIKAVPLGQTAGQRILAHLTPCISQAVDHAMQTDDDHRQAFTPMLAIVSAQHETQYSRLFRS